MPPRYACASARVTSRDRNVLPDAGSSFKPFESGMFRFKPTTSTLLSVLPSKKLREIGNFSPGSPKGIGQCVTLSAKRVTALVSMGPHLLGPPQDVGLYDIEDVLNPRLPRSTPSAYSQREAVAHRTSANRYSCRTG